MPLLRTTCLAATLCSATAWAAERPNIILFMVDDMGWQDTSVPFYSHPTPLNARYRTPHMERLAQRGMKFTQAYASAISSPSRCSLLTGSNAARHRVTNWTLRQDQMTDDRDSLITLPQWNVNGLSPVEGIAHTYYAKSYVQLLQEAGYHTIHVGKAHWAALGTPGEDPLRWGFNVNIGGHAGGGPATYLSERNYGHDDSGQPTSLFAVPHLEQHWGSGKFLTEALTEEALAELDRSRARSAEGERQPFFLHMAHYAIHVPIERDMRYYPQYLERGLSPKEAAYASLIEGMDKSLGDILHWLDRTGEASNTIIIFMSDNGGYATGSYWRDPPLYTQNAPLRCGKGSLYEGGIREPMIVAWPGVTKGASCSDAPILIEDFFPTLLEMAGIHRYEVPQVVDGQSFVPLLKGCKGKKGRALVWNFPNIWDNSGPGISLNCALRSGKWKLIYNYKTGQHELYDLSTDIGEFHDLSTSHPTIVRRLSRTLGRELRHMDAQRPSFTATSAPCAWPDDK